MKVLLRTAWVIPILTLRLILWPDENNAAGKNCCVSKTGAVACQHCQGSPSQAGATTTAAKQSAACGEKCCGKASDS
jgi:hypothetical protein